jgi:hypothetical protein
LIETAERLTGRHCACRRAAVVYLQWFGSVHRFYFASDEYTNLFRQANRENVLG